MSKKTNDIADDEIRIISSSEPNPRKKRKRWLTIYLPIIALGLLALAIVLIFSPFDGETEDDQPAQAQNGLAATTAAIEPKGNPANAKGSVTVIDTVINDNGLLILYPDNLRPRLTIGSDKLDDPSILLATQAADIRGDNGQIAGTFVMKGEVISKGEAKAGFCSIINDEVVIGVSDATPMLEQALTEDGYFFRQYPLVVGAQIVENKPKGKALRKALAEIDGKICVIMSKEKLTFHDFSRLLIDAGARNAIYLVGSTSYGFYVDERGEKILTGETPKTDFENVSYIIWENSAR